MTANLEISFLFLAIVETHDSLTFVIFDSWVCLEAEQEFNHLLVVISDSKGESRATGQIPIVHPGVSLEQHSHHEGVITLCGPDQATLLHFIKLEDQLWIHFYETIHLLKIATFDEAEERSHNLALFEGFHGEK